MNWPSRGFGSSSKKATRARQSLRRHSSVAIRERSQSNSGMQRTRPCAERLRRLFYTAAGEVLDLPECFDKAIRNISGAVACPGCKHTHVAVAPATNKGGEL